MLVRESSERHAKRVVRTTQKAEKKHGERHPRPYERVSRRVDLIAAMAEWAADYEGTHSIFED